MNHRKKPGVTFWAAAVVVCLPLLYVLSFGPACWWFATKPNDKLIGSRNNVYKHAPRMYWPLGWLAKFSPRPLDDAIFWIATRRDDLMALPTDPAGASWYGSRTVRRAFKQ
jgi:hypothetical protein